MSDLYSGLEAVDSTLAPPPALPRPPAGLYEGLELAPAPTAQGEPRQPVGLLEHIQAGAQGSVAGHIWRRNVPSLVLMDPEASRWWERLATGVTQVAADLPIMIPAGAAGGTAGTAAAGPVGGILTGGAAMFAAPAAIRESLVQAYKARDAQTPADWFNIIRDIATVTAKEAAVGAVTMGAGALARGGAAAALGGTAEVAKAVGLGTATMATRGAARAAGAADMAGQIAGMVAAPAALHGELPKAQDFVDAAAVILTLKAGHMAVDRVLHANTTDRLAEVYAKTGKTPAEQVQDAQRDPDIAADLSRPPVDPVTGTTSGVPVKLDKVIAEAEFLARGGVPEAPDIRQIIREIKAEGPLQGDMVRDIDRIGALYDQARQAPLTNPERVELEALRLRVARGAGVEPAETTAMRFEAGQVAEAQAKANERLAELEKKAQLTDAERAERVMLTNAPPEAIARHFGMEPARVIRMTPEALDASAQKVHDDILRQLREVDQARRDSGLAPLGEDHAAAVAALVRARVRTRAQRLGMLPEEVYAERPLQIRDETAAEVAAVEAAIPPEAPRFEAPEVDLFGAPIQAPNVPRYAIERLETKEVPLADLVLSKEVPQFKHAADERGVIVPLGGRFDRIGVGPIQIWERTDGTLEVISGRHRLDLARRSGEETIPAQIHREAEGFTAARAAALDAELNIREEQGSVADYVQHFKASGITKEAADELGLLARAKGKQGFAIARDGTGDLWAAHRADRLSDEAALSISAAAPGSDRLQALGMAMVQEGKSILVAVNTMKAVDLMAAERMAKGAQGDIFGFDDSAMREASIMAKRASSMQRKISEQISAVSGASKRPELARKMGVDVQDPQGIQKRIGELRQEQTLWDNWPLHPELVAKLRQAMEPAGVTGREGELKQGPVPHEAWRDAPTDEAGYLKDSEVRTLEYKPYVKDGEVVASSRMVPNMENFPPVGSWRIAEVMGIHGREIEQLVELPIESLRLNELDARGRLDPTKAGDDARYAEWLKEGKRAPPINVVQTDAGTLSVTDGHRRALAAKQAGRETVEAWVNYAVPIPDGGRYNSDPSKPFIRTGMTFEMLTGEIPNPYLDRLPFSMSFELKPETPAELAARNREAEAQAMRKIAQEAAAERGKKVTVDQADLFNTQNTLFQSGPGAPWYSALERAIEANPTKSQAPGDWKAWLKNLPQKGVKADEIKWSGIEEWLDLQGDTRPEIALPTDKIDPISEKTVYELGPNPDYGKTKVTKAQVQEFLAGNGVKVTETELGPREQWRQRMDLLETRGMSNLDYNEQMELGNLRQRFEESGRDPVSEERQTKFSQYTLPGAKEGSYRELLLTLPTERVVAEATITENANGSFTVRLGNQTARMPSRSAAEAMALQMRSDPQNKAHDASVFTSSHFDEPNILAHIRFNEREITRSDIGDIERRLVEAVGAKSGKSLGSGAPAVGIRKGLITEAEAADWSRARGMHSGYEDKPGTAERVLFIEEIQSDWAQKGKKEGFTKPQLSELPDGYRVTELGENGMEQRGTGRFAVLDAEGQQVNPDHATFTSPERAVGDALRDINQVRTEFSRVPAAPFVGKTDAWVALTMKRMIRYAAENGMDRVAWTTGEQQVSRYTSALRKAVDAIEWKKTPEGVHLVGYKGREIKESDVLSAINADITAAARRAVTSNDNLGFDSRGEAMRAVLDHADWERRWGDMPREDIQHIRRWASAYHDAANKADRRTKVVDTTEKEDVLSDAIGKAMADRIRNDPAQSGTIEGENIKVDDTGMATFYDRIVPNVAKDVLKKLGGGGLTETEIDQPSTAAEFPSFTKLTDQMAETFQGAEGFKDGTAPMATTVRMIVDGRTEQMDAVVSRDGLHMINEDGTLEVLFPGEPLSVRHYAQWESGQEQAMHLLRSAWLDPNSGFWDKATVIIGEARSIEPQAGTTSRQASFEITPAMRERAMEGLPLFQSERASYQIAERLITTMQGADKSSVVHELGHDWLEEMKFDAARPDAPAGLKADWETLRRELAIGEDGEISRSSHEQFARSVERYLMDGEAPSVGLRGVFERFRAWLLEIYQSVVNLNVKVNPDLKVVLDRMLATDQEIADARALGVPRAYVAEARQTESRKIVPGFKAEQVALEPYADELPKGPGEAPDNSHVNYATVDGSTRIKLTLQRLAEIDQQNIQKHRGGKEGVETWREEQATMEKWILETLGGGEDKLNIIRAGDPNDPKTNHMLRAKKQMMVGAGHESERLRDVILEKGHNATIEEQLQYLSSIELLRQMHAEFLGERAAVARAMNALKDTTEGSAAINSMLEAIGRGQDSNTMFQSAAEKAMADQAMLKARLDEILLRYKGKTVLDIARLHKEIGTLKGTFKLAEAIEKASTWEMVVEGWKSSVLSGPVTHATNLFGTGAFQALRPAVDALSAVIGMARGASPGMGESDRASMSEAVARVTGMLGGVVDGLKAGKAAFDMEPTGKTESYREAIPGRAGRLIRIPLRLMGAEDAIVSTMYKQGELAALAIRQAFNEGRDPGTREFADRVEFLKQNPTPEMELAADQAATRMTFNMPLGEKGVALQLFVNKWNLQWMIPFIRTPINITKEVARMSPFAPLVGEWRADIAKGGVARDRALAETALGTGIMALTMAYAFSGQITGSGGPDPGKNRGKAGVEQPMSWKVGDTWYEYARIQPVGTLMGMAADMAIVWDHMTEEEKDKVPKLLARAFSNAVTNQTFLQGITNVINAMSEPARFAPRFLQQLAGSMVPNIVGQPTTMADPVVREVNSALEAIQARVPGMRQNLLPKRDWLGEPVETKERLGVVGPVRTMKVTDDKVRLEAARLDISLAAAPKKTHIGKGTGKLGDVELTPEERNKFAEAGGKMAHKILTGVVSAQGYDQMPDIVKRRIFAKVLTASHQYAAVQALPMEKRVQLLQSITEKVAAELLPPEQ